jgi:hypothetical protein
MSVFVNQAAFNDPASRSRALGFDFNPNRAIVDSSRHVLAYAQSGGMLSPQRWQLDSGETIYRFGGAGRTPEAVSRGAWWVQRREFERLLSFAQTHELGIGMAVRLLCLVPPEWSDIGLLVRARVQRSLLAWRGLANTAVIPATSGGGGVRLPHQNEIAARRLHQPYIPGLDAPGMTRSAIHIENNYLLDPAESVRGFLYL